MEQTNSKYVEDSWRVSVREAQLRLFGALLGKDNVQASLHVKNAIGWLEVALSELKNV